MFNIKNPLIRNNNNSTENEDENTIKEAKTFKGNLNKLMNDNKKTNNKIKEKGKEQEKKEKKGKE